MLTSPGECGAQVATEGARAKQVGVELARRAVVWLVKEWPSEPFFPLGSVRSACVALHGAMQLLMAILRKVGVTLLSFGGCVGFERNVGCVLGLHWLQKPIGAMWPPLSLRRLSYRRSSAGESPV